jgi:hypothetical protein
MRLNRSNVALNRQELRHATYWGPFIKSVERITDVDYWTMSGIFTPNDIRRMNDAEFVSELVIGMLHGPQNKKVSLDKWYETYETEFPDRSRVEAAFLSALGELQKILPNIKDARWRKKSDFYTLALCFLSHTKDLPLTRKARVAASKALLRFGEDVDLFISNGGKARKEVKTYVHAVERAASDLSNRKIRAKVLESVLRSVW